MDMDTARSGVAARGGKAKKSLIGRRRSGKQRSFNHELGPMSKGGETRKKRGLGPKSRPPPCLCNRGEVPLMQRINDGRTRIQFEW